MRVPIVLGISVVVAAAVATCGPAAPSTGSYVAEFTNGAAYVAWTRTETSLLGNFSQAIWRNGANALTNEAFSVTGSADGNGVSLILDGGLGLRLTAVGTFSGDTLTLTFPSTDGKMNEYTFRPGTQADYATLVAGVQARIDAANAEADALAQQQEAERLAREVEAQRQAALDKAVTDAALALQSTLRDADLQVAMFESAVGGMEDGLDAVKDAYQTMLDNYNNTFVPSLAVRPMDDYQVGTVSYNLGALDYDNGGIAYELETVRSYFGDQAAAARSDAITYLAAVKGRISALTRALEANPGFSTAMSPATAQANHDRLVAQVTALDERQAAALATAATYETDGNALYAKAAQAALAVGAS